MDLFFPIASIVFPAALLIIAVLLWKLRPSVEGEARFLALISRTEALTAELTQAQATAANDKQALAAHQETLVGTQQKLRETEMACQAGQTENTELRAHQALLDQKQEQTEKQAEHWRHEAEMLLQKFVEIQREPEFSADGLEGNAAGIPPAELPAEHFLGILSRLQQHLQEYEAALDLLKRDTYTTHAGLRQEIRAIQWVEQALHQQARAFSETVGLRGEDSSRFISELQMQQLVEFVGMQEYCLFPTASPSDTREAQRQPDMIIHLPDQQSVVVDAKAAMDACREAWDTTDEVQRAHLLDLHCQNIKARIDELASPVYRESRGPNVEVVVLFLPSENLYATALENDLSLIQFALERSVVLCGPNSLMMLLKVASQIWQRAAITQEAERVRRAGMDVYRETCQFITQYARLGQNIQQVMESYDAGLGTLDAQLIPAGSRLSHLTGTASEESLECPAALNRKRRYPASVGAAR